MCTKRIAPPSTLKSCVGDQVNQGGHGDCARELIGKDQDRRQLRGLLLVGAAGAPTGPVDAVYFAGLRDRVRKASKVSAQG
ncbi:MAG: type II toxin-antitoxin system ParD family antitoxin [Giesbergeria sp.]